MKSLYRTGSKQTMMFCCQNQLLSIKSNIRFADSKMNSISRFIPALRTVSTRTIYTSSAVHNIFKVQTPEEFEEKVLKSKSPVVVDFFATWVFFYLHCLMSDPWPDSLTFPDGAVPARCWHPALKASSRKWKELPWRRSVRELKCPGIIMKLIIDRKSTSRWTLTNTTTWPLTSMSAPCPCWWGCGMERRSLEWSVCRTQISWRNSLRRSLPASKVIRANSNVVIRIKGISTYGCDQALVSSL